MFFLGLLLGATALPALAQTAQDLQNLNSTVGGRLYVGIPWAEPCFSSFNGNPVTPDPVQCAFVQQNFFNNHLNRSQFFSGYDATNFETCMATGDQCELDWSNPQNPAAFAPPADCKQGSIPNYYIDVRNASDVIAALKFVNSTGVTLVIKNTGHDFKGRSSAPGALALWMHNMKSLVHVPNFVPDSCSNIAPQSAVTYGAGSQFAEIYQFAYDNNLTLIGGSDQSVGAAGGWHQGGGHSPLSPTLGLGADRALEYKIVTTDGVLRTANACQNSDLFWALRGGGGGTFGIVLSVTVQASEPKSYRVANINWPVSPDNLRQVLAVYLDNATTFATQGWGGYFTPSEGNLIVINSQLSTAQAQQSMQALLSLTQSLGGVSTITEVPTFFDWFNEWVEGKAGVQDSIGLPIVMGSRIIPQANHATAAGRAQVLEALLNAFNSTSFAQMCLTAPYAANQSDADTSTNPIWRTALYHVILVNDYEYNATLAERQAAYTASSTAANFLRNITVNGGAYVNEADVHEPNFEYSFWNSKYERLLEIKNKYDPSHILDCWHCIGWKGASFPQYKCYI
ncbi:FAD-binding domain-containing protein [Gymnopilus junonius]|uniref:FAD-binding domain-containing protein n=1 Tax=Gymnopilus junonius TaxID=109634 RepID=A0A9P5NI61_GYMJU|nr:FAD-binding domain-containing protein [Gymnopilus junonius]